MPFLYLQAFVWLGIATYLGLPVSTTHSLIGGLVGIGLMTHGSRSIQWSGLLTIVFSLVTSPLLGGSMAYTLFGFVQNKVLRSRQPYASALVWIPHFFAVTMAVCVSFVCLSGPQKLQVRLLTIINPSNICTTATLLNPSD